MTVSLSGKLTHFQHELRLFSSGHDDIYTGALEGSKELHPAFYEIVLDNNSSNVCEFS